MYPECLVDLVVLDDPEYLEHLDFPGDLADPELLDYLVDLEFLEIPYHPYHQF